MCKTVLNSYRYAIVFSSLLFASHAQSQEPVTCIDPQNAPITGVVLLTHGLNQNPDTFESLRAFMREQGLTTCQLQLLGHEADKKSKHAATSAAWYAQFSEAVHTISERYPNTPFSALGYSIGAALTVAYIDRSETQPFDHLLFIAPAFSLKWYTWFIRLLQPLRFFNLSIPSMSPKQYRAHRSTSLDSYAAAFTLVDDIGALKHPAVFENIHTQIVISDDDEVVSSAGVRAWLKRNGLERWHVERIKHSADSTDRYDHLLVDESSAGPAGWNALKMAVAQMSKPRQQ